MANIAVIQVSGAQHLVKPGYKIEVNKLDAQAGDSYSPEVLLSTDGENVMFNDGKVEAKIVEQKKGEKIFVIKFKAKSRYRRRNGHRQHLSVLEVVSINGEKKAPSKTKSEGKVEDTAVIAETKPKATKKVASTKSKAK